MNSFKYLSIILSLLCAASIQGAPEARASQIMFGHPKAGIATTGHIIHCPKMGDMLCLYDAHGKCLWNICCKYTRSRTLQSIKSICPSCIDTSRLKYIRDFTAPGTWNRLFGKKITA